LFKTNKIVYRLSNATKAIGGVCSNTLQAPRNAVLDRNGRIIATFDQKYTENDELVMVFDPVGAQRIEQYMQMYLLISRAQLSVEDRQVFFSIESGVPISSNEKCELIQLAHGALLITQQHLPATLSDDQFLGWRLDASEPIQGIDYDQTMLLNIGNDRVSFSKGCFVGQEVIARVHYKSRPPKALKVVKVPENENERVAELTSAQRQPDGSWRGFCFVSTAQ